MKQQHVPQCSPARCGDPRPRILRRNHRASASQGMFLAPVSPLALLMPALWFSLPSHPPHSRHGHAHACSLVSLHCCHVTLLSSLTLFLGPKADVVFVLRFSEALLFITASFQEQGTSPEAELCWSHRDTSVGYLIAILPLISSSVPGSTMLCTTIKCWLWVILKWWWGTVVTIGVHLDVEKGRKRDLDVDLNKLGSRSLLS